MIAPHASIGKSEWKLPPAGSRDCGIVTGDHHGFVNGIIILPNSGQARAKLECDWGDCCLRARSRLGVPDSSAPQPPGVQGGSGPLSESMRSAYGSIPMTLGRLEPAFFYDRRVRWPSKHARSRVVWSSVYWIAASVAPRIVFGFSTVPLCTNTVASSMLAPLSVCTGMLHELALPVQSPSLTHRRTTL